tara:strand:- start:53 stop:367 length:315 start_codon:yes stop_codon:yes gene_type:complete
MSNGQQDDIGPDVEDFATEEETVKAELAFLDLDSNGTVDLDALFDALNIAASEGNAPIDFIEAGESGGGRLIISGTDLQIGGGAEDVSGVADMLTKSNIVSDES